MKIIIAGGTGFVGQFLVKHYLEQQHELTVIGRSRAKIQKVFGNQVQAQDWNTLRQAGVPAIENKDLIINLAGANIATQRWTNDRKNEIVKSRVTPTQTLANLCAKLGDKSPPLFNASAIGIYGTQKESNEGLPPKLTEETKINFNTHQFAQEVVKRWEAATQPAKDAGVRVVCTRFGVVLGKNGGALTHLKLPFMFGLGGRIGSGQQPFCWVSLSDIKNAIDFLVQQKQISGPVNVTSPNCVTQKQFAKTLASVLKRPAFLAIPSFFLHSMYGQMAEELLLHGQHVYPEALLQHGFNFEMPELKPALEYALK